MGELGRILLVDDSAKDIELTMAALEKHRLANDVVVTRNGTEALDYLFRRGKYAARPAGNPVIVLLDLEMPKMDGLEALRAMRADERFRGLPVVVLSSSREERDVVESYHLGANAYVVKPITSYAFFNAVSALGLYWGVLNEPPPGGLRRAA
jgi:CheY-like chemotaxis protein